MHGPLTVKDLFPLGPLKRLGRQVHTLAKIDSTNAFLLSRAGTLPDGTVAVAEYQTSGRARQGRHWTAPRGSSILLSVLLIESAESSLALGGGAAEATARAPQAAMLAALAACEAVEAGTDCQPTLRWPNDLMLAGKKLGGVLAESTPLKANARRRGRRALVVGVGLNCLQQPGHFRGELADRATSLEIESAQPIDRAALARGLLERLDSHLAEPADGQRVRAAWRARCDDLGARVTVLHNGRTFTGTVLDITEEADLLVQLEQGGRRRFGSTTTTRLW